MPNRCGIFHVRSNITEEMVTDTEIEDHNKNMEKKLKALLDVKTGLSDEEANKLGEQNLLKSKSNNLSLYRFEDRGGRGREVHLQQLPGGGKRQVALSFKWQKV